MKIFIVILHYGELSVTQRCVESVVLNDRNFEKIIIINNMNDEISAEHFERFNKFLVVINNKKNLGFAAGVNVGIRYAMRADADYVFLLNNDTAIEKPFLRNLGGFFRTDKNIGIVAPAIKYELDGREVYDIGGKVNMHFGRTSHQVVDDIYSAKPQRATYVSGCCMMIKAEVFEKCGMFDESYFLYYEDVDFCLRAKKDGFLAYVVPGFSIYHELSRSAGKLSKLAVYHQIRSAVIFGKKNINHRILNVLFCIFQTLIFAVKKPSVGFSAIWGLKDGINFANK